MEVKRENGQDSRRSVEAETRLRENENVSELTESWEVREGRSSRGFPNEEGRRREAVEERCCGGSREW